MKNKSIKQQKVRSSNLCKPTLVALAIAHSANAHAATIYVGGELGRGCGLSAAILSANQDITHPGSQCIAGDGDDVIELNRDITIRKSWKTTIDGERIDTHTGMPLIESNITINGNGHSIRRDSSAAALRLFWTDIGTTFSLNDLTLKNGVPHDDGRGGAVLADGNLYVSNCQVSANENAFFTYNRLRITDTNFFNNRNSVVENWSRYATSVYVKNSQFENNSGTAITVRPEMVVSPISQVEVFDSAIVNNSGPSILIERSNIVDIRNTDVIGGSGRGVDLRDSQGSIKDSIISGNSDADCAGVKIVTIPYILGTSDISILNSTISNNSATESYGGGVCSIAIDDFYTAAISDITIENSVLTGNSAHTDGGGFFTRSSGGSDGSRTSTTALINTTVSNNNANGSGGGVFLEANTHADVYGDNPIRDTRLTLINATLTGNSAATNGGIEAKAAYLNFTNSIIAGNFSAGSANAISANTDGNFTGEPALERSENNLLGSLVVSNFEAFSGFTPSNSDITATSDGTTPTQLASIIQPLADNGGATLTHALVAGSPAIDAANNTVCMEPLVNRLDQRGEARDDGQCDIGAYELQANTGGLPFISVDDVRVVENDTTALLRIKLSEPQTDRITVDYQTVDRTANDGLDYVARSGSMTFAPGQTQKVRAIKLVNDNLAEDRESFNLLLSNPVGARLDDSVGTVEIIDDDGEPLINIEPASVSVSEGARVASYRVTLSSPQTKKVSVDFQTEDQTATAGVDYVERSGTMTFAIGQTSKIRTVKILQDDVKESDERFRFILSNPSGAVLDQSSTISTIIDDD